MESTIYNLITTGNFKSLEMEPKEQFRRLEMHTGKVKDMFDVILAQLMTLESGINSVGQQTLISAQEFSRALYGGGTGVIDHASLTNLNYAAAGHIGFEATLGNPSITGQYLVSTTGGARSWVTLPSFVPSARTVTVVGPLAGGGALSSDITISIVQADSTHDGYITATAFNGLTAKLSDAPSDGSSYGRKDGSWVTVAAGGSVTTVSVSTNDGVSGTVANATTTPAITLTLGAITPQSVDVDSGYGYKIATKDAIHRQGTSWFVGEAGTVGQSDSGDNVVIGYASAASMTSGGNTIIGSTSGQSLTTGNQNTLIGWGCGNTITSGQFNLCIGLGANPSSATAEEEFVVSSLATGNETSFLRGKFHVTESSQYLKVYGYIRTTQGYKSTDDSIGATTSFSTADTKTITVKNGLITNVA